MSFLESARTRIDIKAFADEPVAAAVMRDVLEAARSAPSGRNSQHWRFVLLDEPKDVTALGERSPSGGWVADAAFAVVVATDPRRDWHLIDAGKAITHMQFAAWDHGVGSAMYTVEAPAVRELVGLPDDLHLTAAVGFGYPIREIRGVKDRRPLEEIAFGGQFGEPLPADVRP